MSLPKIGLPYNLLHSKIFKLEVEVCSHFNTNVFQIYMEFMLPTLLSKEWVFKPQDSTTLAVQMPKNFGMKKMVQLKLGLCRKLMLVKKLQSTTAHLKFL